MILRSIALAALFLVPSTAPQPGTVYRISILRESAGQSSDGSASSSHDVDEMVERVIAMRDGGVELEYDIAKPTKEDRDIAWQYPARLFRPASGPLQLLNGAELQRRADAWRKRARLPLEACGKWYFTWAAFRVECDPQAILPTLAALDIQPPDLRDGAPYRDPRASAPAPLVRTVSDANGAAFVVDLALDPETVRKERVDADLVTAEILRKPLTRDDAARDHAKEAISGTIRIAFETDSTGQVWRRTTVVKTTINGAGGKIETLTATETVERRLLSRVKS